jgi:hypothetical protein
VAAQWKIEVVDYCLFSPFARQGSCQQRPPEAGGKLDITERGNVKVIRRVGHNTSDFLSSLGTKQIFEQGGGVEDDGRQEAFRL